MGMFFKKQPAQPEIVSVNAERLKILLNSVIALEDANNKLSNKLVDSEKIINSLKKQLSDIGSELSILEERLEETNRKQNDIITTSNKVKRMEYNIEVLRGINEYQRNQLLYTPRYVEI